jgi:hypothetical protein
VWVSRQVSRANSSIAPAHSCGVVAEGSKKGSWVPCARVTTLDLSSAARSPSYTRVLYSLTFLRKCLSNGRLRPFSGSSLCARNSR